MRVVYSSFDGRFSDSPRAVYEALEASGWPAEHVWLLHPAHAHGFPEGVRTVPSTGPECRQALEEADVVIANSHIDLPWDKRPGTVYLQTWHGTPLKTIHFDVLWAPEGRLDRLTLDVRRWDALLSPNRASTGPLVGAFAFEGEVLETGYPRNDVLVQPRGREVRDRVRRELGIAEDALAVLYTPTWRDDLVDADGEQDFSLHLDLQRVLDALPEGSVLLLRLHYMVSGRLGPVDLPGVVDVSFRPEVSDLYLAADAMVTDYSSTMFDFAVTGKPIVYFVYDLEHYRDSLRGFYIDITEIAPGPLLTTSEEVAAALADLDGVRERHREAYARFAETYCSLEDGHATDRVLQRFFPEAAARLGLPATGQGHAPDDLVPAG